MAFTPIEIIALVLLVLAAVKMIVLLISAKAWMKFAKKLYKNKLVFQLVCLVLAAIVLYYLIQGGMSIIQIFAVMVFTTLLLALGLADPIKKIIPVFEKHIKDKTLFKTYWLYTLVWLALMAWAVIELFF